MQPGREVASVVVDPSSHGSIGLPCQVVESLLTAELQTPSTDRPADLLAGFTADGRIEPDEVPAVPTCLAQARTEGVPKIVELFMLV
jgi:hypothetical protein